MTLVNTETGEIVEVSPEERTAVARLTTAIAALSEAVDFMPIADVVSIKAQVATIQTATKELGMSQEAQELAAEAVRRAEWSLRRATKKGQETGEVRPNGGDRRSETPKVESDLPAPASFFGSKREYEDANAMGELEPHEFDEVLDEAKAEGNLSRANVAAKARQKVGRARPRPAAEVNLNLVASYADRAAREAQKLTADQIRRVKPNAAEWVGGIRNSVEVLQDLLRSLEEN